MWGFSRLFPGAIGPALVRANRDDPNAALRARAHAYASSPPTAPPRRRLIKALACPRHGGRMYRSTLGPPFIRPPIWRRGPRGSGCVR